MNILGLHFGHDAAATVVRNGAVASYVLRERVCRTKHALSLDIETIRSALEDAGVEVRDLDYCAVTSTQNVELIVDDPERLSLKYGNGDEGEMPCLLGQVLRGSGKSVQQQCNAIVLPTIFDQAMAGTFHRAVFSLLFPEALDRTREQFNAFPWIDNFITYEPWSSPSSLADIAEMDLNVLLNSGESRYGFHFPGTAVLDGIEIPTYFINHHACHAASVFYQSGFDESAIHSHDGFASGVSYHSGMYYYGVGHTITPICPHHLTLGALFEGTGFALNLGAVGSPGKLMGLASYGKPRLFDRKFVGNFYDLIKNVGDDPLEQWIEHCIKMAADLGYDIDILGEPDHMTAPVNADIAASTQRLFEESTLWSVSTLFEVLRKSGAVSHNLCLTGGTALNCPANTRVANEGPYRNSFVEPGCDDSGVAVGAAQYLYHNLLDQPIERTGPRYVELPYVGPLYDELSAAEALAECGDSIVFEQIEGAAKQAALDLVENKMIGWFEGRSEIGPRALGHRSILANPTDPDGWIKVNKLKGRDWWRPFAPAVLESEAAHWFRGLPLPSPYMLHTASVRSRDIPATTHVDGTARIQTVNESCGGYFEVLREFFILTGIPVVLNTSFNGPAEPIVETPRDALRFFLNSQLDILYLMGFRVCRSQESSRQSHVNQHKMVATTNESDR